MFKVNIKDTRITPVAFIISFEQVNAAWITGHAVEQGQFSFKIPLFWNKRKTLELLTSSTDNHKMLGIQLSYLFL